MASGKQITQGQYFSQPLNIKQMLSDWDLFTVARAFPGSVNAPYLNNMTVMPLPTGTFSISRAFSTAGNTAATPAAETIGTQTYVAVFFCPALSSFFGPNGTGNLSNSTRVGGFGMFQTSTISTAVNLGVFYQNAYAQSCVGLYGSDFSSFASGGYVFSGQLKLRILAPQANLVGSCYKGTITAAQMRQNPTVSQLIQNSTSTSTGEYEQVLRSSVIEPNLVEDITEAMTTTAPNAKGADNETISYIIYQSAAQSITTGTNMTYNLIAHMDGNFVYYPNPTDTFSYALTPPERKGNAVFETPKRSWVSEIVAPLTNTVVDNSKKYSSAWASVKNVVGKGISWLDDKLTGGAIKGLDDSLFGSALQHSVGLKTAQDKQLDEFERMLTILKSDHGTAPSRSAYSNYSTGANLLSAHEYHLPVSSMVPKDDYVYYFNQLAAITRRFRGTISQTEAFAPFLTLVEETLDWYNSAPDYIDIDSCKKPARSTSKPARVVQEDSHDPDESFRKFR
jgi:hypothetical protein